METGSVAVLKSQVFSLKVEQSAVLKRIREGETELFGQLVQAHQKKIFRVALYYVRDPLAADGLTQDAFIRAFENIHRFREEASFETWLTRITINLCLNYLKQRQTELKRNVAESLGEDEQGNTLTFQIADPTGSPEEQLLRKEMMRGVEKAISLMSAQQKVVFQLRHYEGLSLEEIVNVTQMNIGTIKSHLFRAVQKVRDVLRNRYEK
ncbi:MAG TPA: sigma-70 family RNA polymerase sigma factor [Acidobacteriota bacterium]|jgi:RNA polymerase sigma-70 factor (ECF subfamily)|nr:sigma-70 family RNA polymerase sigma factor [Acidobacteriota bacterium]